MKKERFILNLIVFFVLISCKKESAEAPDDVPDYQTGRLTEVSCESAELGLIYHNYEYAENEVVDSYNFSSSEVFITKYQFNPHCSSSQ